MAPKICRSFRAAPNPTNVIVTATEQDSAIKRREDLLQWFGHKP